MAYESVDRLQKMLAETVFTYADNKKKAAGRALGTLVEIVTFYLLKTWGLGTSVAIERGWRSTRTRTSPTTWSIPASGEIR